MFENPLSDPTTAPQTVKAILGPRLLAQIEQPRLSLGDTAGRMVFWSKYCSLRRQDRPSRDRAADGMIIVNNSWRIRATGGYTLGNYLFPRSSPPDRLFLVHEYVHVLQWRVEGASFLWQYARAGLWNWPKCDDQGWPYEGNTANRYEKQAMQVEACYRYWPDLPDPWLLNGPVVPTAAIG